MPGLVDIAAALSRPLRALVDPAERVFWLFVVSSLAMPWLVIGLRRGTAALRDGLLRRAIWTDPSTRADVTLLFAKALIAAVLRVPWVAATAGAALWVGLALHDGLGPIEGPQWSRPTVAVVYSLVLFVAWDLSRFLMHWLMHRFAVLWAFHQVHHSARVLTPLTLYRTHPVETLLYDLRGLLTTAAVTGVFLYVFSGTAQAIELLGINALGFLFNLAGANLRHSHVWLRFGWVERWLISPAQHQLHHARDIADQTSNLGTWLAIWDRWAGTWRTSPPTRPTEYGLQHANHRHDRVGSMLLAPLLDAAVTLGGRRTAPVAAALLGLVVAPRSAAGAPETEPSPTAPDHEGQSDAPSAEAFVEDEPEPESEPEGVREIVVGSMFAGADAPRTAGSAHAISEREMEQHEYDDVHRLIQSVPGVYVRGEDGFGLRPNIGLRGANPDRSAKVTLLEDGILLGPAPYSAPAAYYFPLPTRMVGMEVFKGPASIRHGPNTIGGAVNILTRAIPDEHTSVVDLAGGRFGYAKGHGYYGTTYKGFGVLLEAARIQTNGFKELDTGGNTGFAKNDGMLKLGYQSPSGRRVTHRIELKGGIASENSNETYLGLSEADFEATPYRRYAASALDNMSWWRTQSEATYLLRQGDTVEVEARLYRHDFDRVWRRLDSTRGGAALGDVLAAPDAGQAAVTAAILRGEQDSVLPQQALLLTNNDRRFVSQGLQTAFRWRPVWGPVSQQLELGARVHGDSIDRHHTEDGFLMTSGVMVPEGTARASTVLNRAQTLATAFHLHDAVTLWDRVTIAPGLRVEVISMRFEDALAGEPASRLDTAVTPGLGALLLATPWLGLFAGVHRGFSPVAPGQPEAVRPEFSANYEAGTRFAWKGLQAEAVGFLSDYSNLNASCTFSTGCVDGDGSQVFNGGAVLVYGLESLARYRRRFDNDFRLEAGARYTYTGSQFRNAFESQFLQWGDVERGDELPYVPKHIAGGTFGVGGRAWDVTASPNFNGAMRDVAGQGSIADTERIDPFFTLDVGAEVRLLKRFRLYTQVGNVTNSAYVASRRPFGIRPGAPLTVMVGLKASILP